MHPLRDIDHPYPWQNRLYDPMDAEGYVHVPERPGLGDDINFDYIRENKVSKASVSLAE